MNAAQTNAEPGSKPWSLAVKAVLLDTENRTLLIRRSNVCRNFVGKWEWPGGKADPSEDFATAVRRESREETALEVQITGLAGATSFEMSTVHVVLLCMECRILRGTIELSEEHDDYAWVPLRDLATWPLTDHVKDLMLDYAKNKGASS